MKLWEVKTRRSLSWTGEPIETCLEEHTFIVKANSIQGAMTEVMKYGAGSIVALDDIWSVVAERRGS